MPSITAEITRSTLQSPARKLRSTWAKPTLITQTLVHHESKALIGHAPELRDLEEQHEAGRVQWLTAVPHIQDAILSKRNAEQDARERIRFEQAPALLKVAELEALRKEKVRQEFEQQMRQDENEKKVEPRHDRGMEL